ncbi:MAG TPA: preprotein translocase subunit SecE [Xanthobacteraceae bacterium]
MAITAFFLVADAQKVTWPARRDTAITTAMVFLTTAMVFLMVAAASVFFLLADEVMRLVVTFLLGIGS